MLKFILTIHSPLTTMWQLPLPNRMYVTNEGGINAAYLVYEMKMKYMTCNV